MITRLPQQLLSIIAAPARRHFLCPLHRHFSSPSLLTPISTHTWESSTHTVRQTISNNIPNLYRNKTKLKDSTFWYESVGGMILRRAEKVVFKTMDGHTIETVCLDYDHDMDYHSNIEDGGRGRTTAPSDKMVPATVCISSQVGCCRDCTFCVNSRFGLIRNLTMEELLFQILYFHYVKDSADRHRHIHSVSFHGIGEPLDNPATFELLEFLNSHYPKEYNQPHPPLTSVSTIGSLDHLDILTDRFPHTSLTFSLLSPFQEVREMLAPSVSKDYPLSQVFKMLDHHARVTGKDVNLSYLLLKGINDDKRHLDGLLRLLKDRKDMYRLIIQQFHPLGDKFDDADGADITAEASDVETLHYFTKQLELSNIKASIQQFFEFPRL